MSNNNKMLIDATHPEETRVVVLKNGRVEEFDFESAARKLLRGNIYLAKVTRVEPSLQAAFVDYGGNRHGFLAFNEIHPDYYQIPVADRQALLEEEAAQEAAEEAEVDAHAERLARRREQRQRDQGPREAGPGEAQFAGEHDDNLAPDVLEGVEQDGHHHDDHGHDDAPRQHEPVSHRTIASAVEGVEQIISETPPPVTVGGFDPDAGQPHDDHDHDHGQDDLGNDDLGHDDHGRHDAPAPAIADSVEPVGGEDPVEEMPQRPRRRPRSYKIQEVIKRRQVILVQVVKEERGNKGAALTTYLSLAGRYTVLMPNTARGGGISRKITQPGDRKRLKAIANELEVPEGMGLIIRTAGASRTSQEIKRDFEYLLRLWESVRELTLASTAPSLVYEEGNLIKRSIRDLYTKDVEEVVVAGEVAHREARDFMRMLMPSHAQNVIEYKGAEPLFTRYRMEQQLAAMFSPQVTLKSGGYLVINQTEALVAVDVNSGKSTREYSIEETALNTNLEAADEIARQLKLRDLAGLIVIDFIDMEEKRNNRNVERRLKDALRFDRARIQLGRISHFGLMEMSRQRLRTGVLEGSTSQCPHCQGTGIIRSIESIALAVLRGLEDTLMSGTRMALIATTTPQVALYILNAKRAYVTDMEARHGLSITVQGSDKLQGANFTIDKVAASIAEPALRRRSPNAVNMEWGFDGENGDEPVEASIIEVPFDESEEEVGGGLDGPRAEPSGQQTEEGRRRRRRGRRNRRDERPMGEGGERGGERIVGNGNGNGAGRGFDDSHVVEVGAGDEGPEDLGGDGGPEDTDREGVVANRAPRGEGEGDVDAEGRSRRGRRRGRRGGRRGGQNRERAPFAANDRNGPGEGGGEAQAGDGGYQADADDRGALDTNGDAAQTVHERAPDAVHASEAPASPGDMPEPKVEHEREERAPRRRERNEPRHAQSKVTEGNEDGTPVVRPEAAAAAVAAEPTVVVPAPVEPVVDAPTVKAPRRVSSASSEPVLERVTVTPHSGAATAAAEDEAAKPTRKGWWQRKLGLE
ncbi:MAG: ribonuclease E/G [Hyphomicrobiaceae bacterium]